MIGRVLAGRYELGEVLGEGVRSNGRERNARLDSERVAEQVVAVYRQVLRQ